MNEIYFKKITTTIILIALMVLSFFLLKPILLSIILGIILAFTLTPVYNWIYKITNSKNLSATLICVLVILAIILPVWFLTPIIIKESIRIYLVMQDMDFVTPLKNIFPSLFASEQFSSEIGSVLHSFAIKTTNSLMNLFTKIITNFMNLFLQLLVVLFTFFFVLRDKEQLISYVQSLLPFSKEVEKKLIESSKGIAISVIYGQIVVGILQGLIVGAGLLIFKVPNALILTLFASLAGILPIIGTSVIWVPVAIYLFITEQPFPALGIIVFGLFSSTIDNFIKPIIISKKTKIHSSIILIGMIGGVFMFGILGFILGPLILAYLLIILELYRNKQIPGFFVQQPETPE